MARQKYKPHKWMTQNEYEPRFMMEIFIGAPCNTKHCFASSKKITKYDMPMLFRLC